MSQLADNTVIVVGALICIIAAILMIPIFAGLGFLGAQQSANLNSGSAELSSSMGVFGLIISIGVLGKMLGGR